MTNFLTITYNYKCVVQKEGIKDKYCGKRGNVLAQIDDDANFMCQLDPVKGALYQYSTTIRKQNTFYEYIKIIK